MKLALTVLSSLFVLSHGSRYGLLRVGSPIDATKEKHPMISRSLFEEIEENSNLFVARARETRTIHFDATILLSCFALIQLHLLQRLS